MASIVFPDLPIEAFYYSGQSENMDLEEWTMPKIRKDSVEEIAEAANFVVWPPILSSDCSTWLATRKAKSDKEKLEESLKSWLAPATTSLSDQTDYVAAVREGLEKSMKAYNNYLNEVTQENKESFVTDVVFIHTDAANKAKAEKKEGMDGCLNPWLVPVTSSVPGETDYVVAIREGLEKSRKAFNNYLQEAIPENNVAFVNPDEIHSTASSSFDNENSVWLNMSDSGKAESIITEAMSTMTMDGEECVPHERCSVWLSTNCQDQYAFDGVESEASIEIIDSLNEDFGNMDEM